MAPRSSWKGFLRLSLVSVPVRAFTANNTGEEVRLNQLHKECHARVRYKKVCEEHGELKSDDIISGYEYSKDQYVIIDPEELAKLRPESDRSVGIQGFVKPDEISPLYLAGKTYYLLPDGPAGTKPYGLLHRGMVDNEVWAIAQVVLSGREQLVLLRPLENMLVMSVLYVSKKIKALDEFTSEIPDQDLTNEERALTNTLIEATQIEEFDYAAYRDKYVERLSELIQLKVDGQEIVQVRDPEEPKIINLMEALKASVAAARGGGPPDDGGGTPAEAAPKRKSAAAAKAPRDAETAERKTGSGTSARKQAAGARATGKTAGKATTKKTAKKAASKKKMAPSTGVKKTARRRKSG